MQVPFGLDMSNILLETDGTTLRLALDQRLVDELATVLGLDCEARAAAMTLCVVRTKKRDRLEIPALSTRREGPHSRPQTCAVVKVGEQGSQ